MKHTSRCLFRLGVTASLGLFIVNTLGFFDTITGSAMGCGKHWPLCNGRLIPIIWNRATTIEYIHRLIALITIVILVFFSVMAWRNYHKWKGIRFLIEVSILSILAEAGLRAISVLVKNPSWVMAFHMGIALTSFSACVLLTIVIRQIGKRPKVNTLPTIAPQNAFQKWSWFTMFYVYSAIYFGAFVSHSGYGALFRGWPIPTESYLEVHVGLWIDLFHRLIALGLLIIVLYLFRKAYQIRYERKDLFFGSLSTLVLTVLQIFSGAYLILSNMSVSAFLIHVSFASLLFVSVAYLVMRTLPLFQIESTNYDIKSQQKQKIS